MDESLIIYATQNFSKKFSLVLLFHQSFVFLLLLIQLEKELPGSGETTAVVKLTVSVWNYNDKVITLSNFW